MRLIAAVVIVALLAAQGPAARAEDSPIKAIDLYGTTQITAEQVRQKFGSDIENLVKANSAGDMEGYGKLYEKIVAGIREMGKFALVGISSIQYYTPGKPVYVTIDVVDEKDRASRMDFMARPRGEFADPDNLFEQWKEYEKAGFALLSKGELNYNFQKDKCPALHCIFVFEHPDLKKYEELFRVGAMKHKALLAEILRQDKNDEHRGLAAYLLAHAGSAEEIAPLMLASIRDPGSYVRNSVLRVLIFVAAREKDARIPLGPIIKAIDYPETTDRNKALYVLDGLAARPENKAQIAREAGRRLVALLKLEQPNNHDPAYSILKNISGKSFGERDYKSWERWAESNAR